MSDSLDKLNALVEKRKARLAQDNEWGAYDDGQVDAAMLELETIQQDMLGTNFAQQSNLLLGLSLLLDGDDQPNFADNFKNELFDVLRVAMSFYDKR